MSNLGFSIVGNPKMITLFHFRVTPPSKGAPRGGLGARGGIPPRIKCYVNSEVFNSGESKNDHHFHFRVPPTPTRAPPGPRWGAGGARGGIPPKIVCYVKSGVFNSGESKNDHHFSL